MNLCRILIQLILTSITVYSTPIFHPIGFTPDILADTVFCYDKNMNLKQKSICSYRDSTIVCRKYDKDGRYMYRYELIQNQKGIPLEMNMYDTVNILFHRILNISKEPGLTYMFTNRRIENNQNIYDTTYEYFKKFSTACDIYMLDSSCENLICSKVNWMFTENSEGYYFERTQGNTYLQNFVYNYQALPIRRFERKDESTITEYFKYDEKNRVIEWIRVDCASEVVDTSRSIYVYRNRNTAKVKNILPYQNRIFSNSKNVNVDLLGRNIKRLNNKIQIIMKHTHK